MASPDPPNVCLRPPQKTLGPEPASTHARARARART
jgi:hypothetical protein